MTVPEFMVRYHVRRLGEMSQQLEDALASRDGAIVSASTHGMSLREIGGAVGMTHSGVAKVLERMKEENSGN